MAAAILLKFSLLHELTANYGFDALSIHTTC